MSRVSEMLAASSTNLRSSAFICGFKSFVWLGGFGEGSIGGGMWVSRKENETADERR
jgi:hypothetical protein